MFHSHSFTYTHRAVVLETSVGDITIDLYTDDCPLACKNFLKLCKLKYYNYCIFHNVQKDMLIQTGDPLGTGKGGESLEGVLSGKQGTFFADEFHKKYKFTRRGLVAMANRGAPNTNQSQFFITTGENLSYMNEKHTIFGEVSEGYEVVERINDAFVDDKGQPWQNIRLRHTIVLDDPFDDPPTLKAPERSPRFALWLCMFVRTSVANSTVFETMCTCSPPKTAINDRLEDTVDVFDTGGKVCFVVCKILL